MIQAGFSAELDMLVHKVVRVDIITVCRYNKFEKG